MIISGMQKLTLLDYPGKLACLLFTQGCNFRCPFCHNKDLLNQTECKGKISEEEVFNYLKKRKNILDGVCITGGEPLLQNDIEEFIRKIKDMGYKVKLDTNGSNPQKLQNLIAKNLLDYIAMDIKNDFLNYNKTSGIAKINLDNIKESIKIIENSSVEYEFRTTIVKELHTMNQLEKICAYLGKKPKYYIQNYKNCNTVLQDGLTEFPENELLEIQKQLNLNYPNVFVRGI